MGRCSDARERLLASAARLLLEQGYSALSVSDLCTDAGLQKGSFYHFFGSKRDLVLAAIEEYGGHQRERLQAILGERFASAREQLARLAARPAHDITREQRERVCGCLLGNLALEMAGRDEAMRAKLAAILDEWRAAFEAVLQRGVSEGEFQLDDPAATARALVAFLEGTVLLAKTTNDPALLRDLSPYALALVDGASPRTDQSTRPPGGGLRKQQ